ncbi:MAG: hypothetical protein QXU13_01175 [Desulfurococcaceae archaeon]
MNSKHKLFCPTNPLNNTLGVNTRYVKTKVETILVIKDYGL